MRLIRVLAITVGLATFALAAKQSKVDFTPAEHVTITEIKAADPDAVVQAAANNMFVDLSQPMKPVLKPLVLTADQRTPVPAAKDVAVELTIDAGQKFQVIDGFGTCTYAHNRQDSEIYAKTEFRRLVVDDLGLSMIRFAIVPAHFKPVENPEQISRQRQRDRWQGH